MSESVIQAGLAKTHLKLESTYNLRPTPPDSDPNIDDPVNDTGLGPHRGDLQIWDEFACLLNVIFEGHGEF